MCRPSKVSKFHVVVSGEEDVLRLQITVNDVVQVTVVKSVGDLIGVLCGTMFIESTVVGSFQVTIEFSFAGELECNINLPIVVKPCEETENVGMPETKVNLVLSSKNKCFELTSNATESQVHAAPASQLFL